MDGYDNKIDVQQQASCECEASLFYKKYKRQIDRIFTEKQIEVVQAEEAKKIRKKKVSSRGQLLSLPSSESAEGIDTLRSDRSRSKQPHISKEDFGQFISPSVIDQELSPVSAEKRDEYWKRVQEKEKSRPKKKIGVVPAQAKKGKINIPDWVLNYQESIMTIMQDESAKQMLAEPIISTQKSDQQLYKSYSDPHSLIKGKKKLFSEKPLKENGDDEFSVKSFEDLPEALHYKENHEKIQTEINSKMAKEILDITLSAEEKEKLTLEKAKKKLPSEKEVGFEKPQVLKETEKDGIVKDKQDSREHQEQHEHHEPREPHEDREPSKPREHHEPREPHEDREPSKPREHHEPREQHEPRKPHEHREPRQQQEPREPHEPRELHDPRKTSDTREISDAKGARGIRDAHDPQDHKQISKEMIISKGKTISFDKEIAETVYEDKEHIEAGDKPVIYRNKSLPLQVSKVDRKSPAKTSRGKIDSRKPLATKSKDFSSKTKVMEVVDEKSAPISIEKQSAKEIAPKETKEQKSIVLEVPIIRLTPPTPKPKKDAIQITVDKTSKQPATPEIHTILKPRPIKSDDGSLSLPQEKEKDVIPMVKMDKKSQHRSVKYIGQPALSKKISSTVSKQFTESLSSEKASSEKVSTSGSSKFKHIQILDEETQRKMKETRQRLLELELAAGEEEDVGLGLDNLSKFDLGSQASYDTKVCLAKKKTTVEQLEDLKITTNTHYLKYLETHKVDELFQFLGSHLVASAPENPVFFLISLLDSCLKYRSHLGAPPLLFQASHVESLYYCMDAMKEGFITIDQYHTGMKTMNIDYYNWNPELNDRGMVSKDTFINEAVAQQKIYLNDLIKPHDIGMSRPRMSDVM